MALRRQVPDTKPRTRLHRTAWVGLSCLAIAAALGAHIPSASAGNRSAPPSGTGGKASARSCEGLTDLDLPHTKVTSAKTVPATHNVPEHCNVQLTVNNPPSDDAVHIGVFLPTFTWNGRFLGTGGGGFVAGIPGNACFLANIVAQKTCALQSGYATAATDAGHGSSLPEDGSFALNPDGTLNRQLIDNFGYLSIHQMTTRAKTVIAEYYGTRPEFSYFFGGSNGGRQALTEAQRYPDDYDGIVAAAPAVSWTKLFPAQLWNSLIMEWADHAVPVPKLTAITNAAVGSCDARDGVKDRIISHWRQCRFDARTVVGEKTPAGAITTVDADIVNKLWEGPRGPQGEPLWHGLPHGTPLTQLVETKPDGTTVPALSPLWESWFKYWLERDPDLDWRTITYDRFLRYFHQSVGEFNDVMGADDPDLRPFRDAGGKLVLWHGTYDPLIPPQGTINYYDRVTRRSGGPAKTRDFARLFIAPGAAHVGSGAGPAPANAGLPVPGQGSALRAVIDWVEHGKAPKQLLGVTDPEMPTNSHGDLTMTRPLCLDPHTARYKGHGNVNDASNFTCGTRS